MITRRCLLRRGSRAFLFPTWAAYGRSNLHACLDLLGRLRPLVAAPENAQIRAILCRNEAGGTSNNDYLYYIFNAVVPPELEGEQRYGGSTNFLGIARAISVRLLDY